MYQWWVFIHLVGVLGFLLAHGVSVAVLFALRREREPGRIRALLTLSGQTTAVFYWSFLVLLGGGLAAATRSCERPWSGRCRRAPRRAASAGAATPPRS